MPKSILALSNLRAFVILLVVAFHSVLAYLGSQPALPPPFDSPPYWWRAIPIIDSASKPPSYRRRSAASRISATLSSRLSSGRVRGIALTASQHKG